MGDMKRIAAIILTSIMTISLAACGSQYSSRESEGSTFDELLSILEAIASEDDVSDKNNNSSENNSDLSGLDSRDDASDRNNRFSENNNGRGRTDSRDNASDRANRFSEDSTDLDGTDSRDSAIDSDNSFSENNPDLNEPASDNSVFPENGVAEGFIGDIMCTRWLNFTINDVLAYGNECAGYEADPGYRLLVLNTTIVNTFNTEIPMGVGDFLVIWDNADIWSAVEYGEFTFPIEADDTLSDAFLPSEYSIASGDTVSGYLLYEVPADTTDFSICFVEIDDQDNIGDMFKVSFQVEAYEDYYTADSDEGDIIYGMLGDTLSTAWFDFTVESASLYTRYEGITSTEGTQFLVLEMTLQNTFFEDVPMFDTDFQVQWADTSPYAYSNPTMVMVNDRKISGDRYYLPFGREINLVMVYAVPADYSDFIVLFEELFDDNTVGDMFVVSLVPDSNGNRIII